MGRTVPGGLRVSIYSGSLGGRQGKGHGDGAGGSKALPTLNRQSQWFK